MKESRVGLDGVPGNSCVLRIK